MKRRNLERLLVAAQDDPVLAAWASVLYEYKANSHSEVPPHEHWEAFQELFSCGLLSHTQYDNTDVKQLFFSGHRPPQCDVQGVFDNLKLMCHEHDLPMEEEMSRAKPPMSAFSNSSALARHESASLAAVPSRNELRPRRAMDSLSAFQPSQAIARPSEVRAFEQPTPSLPCTRQVDARMYVGEAGLNGQIVCCGQPLDPESDGDDIISAEDMGEEEDFALHEFMFHCECANCGSVYHCSVSKPIPRSSF